MFAHLGDVARSSRNVESRGRGRLGRGLIAVGVLIVGGAALMPTTGGAAGGDAAITGRVFVDRAQDGRSTGAGGSDPGVAGVVVTAVDRAGGRVRATTSADGSYSLAVASIGPGPFRIETDHSSATATRPGPLGPGSAATVVRRAAAGSRLDIGLTDGDACTPAGECTPGWIELGDTVWFDTDADGVQDPDEPPLAGVTVALEDLFLGTIATARTDGSGAFRFVSEGSPAALAAGVDAVDGDGDPQPTDAVGVVPAAAGAPFGDTPIRPDTPYTITLDTSTTTIDANLAALGVTRAGLRLTEATAGTPGIDSDAIDLDGGVAGEQAGIVVVTRSPGESLLDLDAGFTAPITPTPTGSTGGTGASGAVTTTTRPGSTSSTTTPTSTTTTSTTTSTSTTTPTSTTTTAALGQAGAAASSSTTTPAADPSVAVAGSAAPSTTQRRAVTTTTWAEVAGETTMYVAPLDVSASDRVLGAEGLAQTGSSLTRWIVLLGMALIALGGVFVIKQPART